MNNITQDQINKAIKDCVWKRNVTGIDVCGGTLAPCEKLIAEGKCDTLIHLFHRADMRGEEE